MRTLALFSAEANCRLHASLNILARFGVVVEEKDADCQQLSPKLCARVQYLLASVSRQGRMQGGPGKQLGPEDGPNT